MTDQKKVKFDVSRHENSVSREAERRLSEIDLLIQDAINMSKVNPLLHKVPEGNIPPLLNSVIKNNDMYLNEMFHNKSIDPRMKTNLLETYIKEIMNEIEASKRFCLEKHSARLVAKKVFRTNDIKSVLEHPSFEIKDPRFKSVEGKDLLNYTGCCFDDLSKIISKFEAILEKIALLDAKLNVLSKKGSSIV